MKKSNRKWILVVTLLAFILSIIMSFISSIVLKNVTLIVSIIVTFLFILLGIVFDIIGVATTCGDEEVFHSMGARKIRSGKIGVRLIKNASKVSSVCCDVIGDICGIISGTTGSILATKIALKFSFNEFYTILIITGFISALTIGGKALGKTLAINKSNYILYDVSKAISNFKKK